MRRFLKTSLAIFTLLWTVFGLFWATWLVLPSPNLVIWAGSALVSEFSLLLAVFSVVGLLLALLVRRVGFGRTSAVAGVFGVVAVVLCIVPVAQALQTARSEGISLFFGEYFSGVSAVSSSQPDETVTYASPEGKELTLDVWEPPASSDANRPAIVMVHGGSWEEGVKRSFARRPAWLSDQGYVVFDIGYRLSPPPRWRDAPADVKCAVGWVGENAGEYGVDPERIALMGDSAGAHLALLSAYTTGNPEVKPGCDVPDTGVDAVVAFYPPTDLATLCESNRPGWYPKLDCGSLYRFMGGRPEELPERYGLVSPINHVDPDDPPTFVVHGGRDQIVLVEQSRKLDRRLEEEDVPHELLEIPYADHAFDISWGGWGNQVTNKKVLEFLDRHFPTDGNRRSAAGSG